MVQLQPEEVAAVRAKVEGWGRRIPRGSAKHAIVFEGGPLDGITAWTDSGASPLYVGCCHIRHNGPVSVRYKHAGERVWRFDGSKLLSC